MANMDEFVRSKTVIDVDVFRLKELCLEGKFPELSAIALMAADDDERKVLSQNNETAKRINEQINKVIADKKLTIVNEIMDEFTPEKDEFLDKWSRKVALKMLEKGIDIDVISNEVYLSEEEIEALK